MALDTRAACLDFSCYLPFTAKYYETGCTTNPVRSLYPFFKTIATRPHRVTPPTYPFLHIVSCIHYLDIKWFRLEKYYTGSDSTFMEQPLFYQYLYILLLCIIGQSLCMVLILPHITWSTHLRYPPPKRICRFSSRSSHRCSMAVPRTKIPEHQVPLYWFLVTAWLASTNLLGMYQA